MGLHSIKIVFGKFSSIEELDVPDRALFKAAIRAMKSAYAPYSEFPVGAAILLENGEIILGSNQENIAYPSGLCAERVALFAAATQFPDVPIVSLAITTQPQTEKSASEITPCGACRQVMLEYERRHSKDFKVITGAANGPITVFNNAQSLLPLAFFDEALGS
ncbi:MAG: cytidine deaminase [Flavobacteriales bacterium]|nr:cytidine deaminase [Flavobacteriales bacterium]